MSLNSVFGMERTSRGGSILKDRYYQANNGKPSCRARHVRGGSSPDLRIQTRQAWRNMIKRAFLCSSIIVLLVLMVRTDWIPVSSDVRTVQLVPPMIFKDRKPSDSSSYVSALLVRPTSTVLELNRESKIDDSVTALIKDVHKDYSEGTGNPIGLSNRMKIYIYDLPSSFNQDWLKDDRCRNHLFAAEVAIHQQLLRSPIRTLDPQEADFFYMPVYITCKFSNSTGFPAIGHARLLLKSAVKHVSHQMPYWNRNKGRDHVFVTTHDYGPCFHTMEDLAEASGIPPYIQNSIFLQTFGKTGKHACQTDNSIQIPPYVPLSIVNSEWHPEHQQRDIFAYFRGKMELHPKNFSGRVYSRGVRSMIWKRFRHNRRFFVERTRSPDYHKEISRSIFCLCPLGWAPWSPRIVESVVLGCIPVIIADKIALPYSHIINWSQISVTVPEKDVRRLGKILDRIYHTNLTAIQGNLWNPQYRKALMYMDPLTNGDATWQILELLSRKISNRSNRLNSRLLID